MNKQLNRIERSTRRRFLRSALLCGVGAYLASESRQVVRAAADELRLAVLGTGPQGLELINTLSRDASQGCRITHLCDPDSKRLEQAQGRVNDTQGGRQKVVLEQDLRKLFDSASKSIDAVIIATPSHWQAYSAIRAMQAGLDVYIEAPIAYSVEEASVVRQIAASYRRIAQAGTQFRSLAFLERLRKEILPKLGKVTDGRIIAHSHQRPRIPDANQDAPSWVNYDLWLGPAPAQSFSQRRFHHNWRWMQEFGLGDLGDNSVHWLDLALMLAGGKPRIISAESQGAQIDPKNQWEFPDTQSTVFQFRTPDDEQPLSITCMNRAWSEWNESNELALEFEQGQLRITRHAWQVTSLGGEAFADVAIDANEWTSAALGRHVLNFLKCIRERSASVADVAEHQATWLCQLGNAALVSSQKLEIESTEDGGIQLVNKLRLDRFIRRREYRRGFDISISRM